MVIACTLKTAPNCNWGSSKKRTLKPVYEPLLLSGVQTQGSRSEGKGAIWHYWPPLGTKHNLFDLESTLFQEMRDGTAMHSGEKERLDLFTTMGVNSGCQWSLPISHDWTGRGGSPGGEKGDRRLPSVQAADEVLLVCVCCNPWDVCHSSSWARTQNKFGIRRV